MNVYDYIEKYGDYTFNQKRLNDVDAMIFSFLSYASLSEIMKNNPVITIHEAGEKHLDLYRKKDNNIMAVREGNKILRTIKDKKRYRNCILSKYEYIGNEKVQFGVLSIEYLNRHTFVAFEGTDALISGWKEDVLLGSEFPTESHKLAIQYLNRHFTFNSQSLIIGGHSKGGNLALVAGMYANFIVRSKITKIYNGDGPGLLEEQFVSDRYKKIEKKYIHIIPNYSIIGVLLETSNEKVVESTNKGILCHNFIYWKIEDNHFKKSVLSNFSQELDKEMTDWIKNNKKEDKKELAEGFADLMKRSNIDNLLDLKMNYRKVFRIIKESKNTSETTKKMAVDLIKILLKCFKNTKTEEFKSFIMTHWKSDKKQTN